MTTKELLSRMEKNGLISSSERRFYDKRYVKKRGVTTITVTPLFFLSIYFFCFLYSFGDISYISLKYLLKYLVALNPTQVATSSTFIPISRNSCSALFRRMVRINSVGVCPLMACNLR